VAGSARRRWPPKERSHPSETALHSRSTLLQGAVWGRQFVGLPDGNPSSRSRPRCAVGGVAVERALNIGRLGVTRRRSFDDGRELFDDQLHPGRHYVRAGQRRTDDRSHPACKVAHYAQIIAGRRPRIVSEPVRTIDRTFRYRGSCFYLCCFATACFRLPSGRRITVGFSRGTMRFDQLAGKASGKLLTGTSNTATKRTPIKTIGRATPKWTIPMIAYRLSPLCRQSRPRTFFWRLANYSSIGSCRCYDQNCFSWLLGPGVDLTEYRSQGILSRMEQRDPFTSTLDTFRKPFSSVKASLEAVPDAMGYAVF